MNEKIFQEIEELVNGNMATRDRVRELAVALVNDALEEAAQIFEKDDSQRWGYTADLEVISAAIRAKKV